MEIIRACRICDNRDITGILDLGKQPYANSLLANLNSKEEFYPLSLSWCPECNLVQLNQTAEPEDLWRTTFKSRNISGHLLCVYYGWSRGDRWSATEGARWEYAGSPYLYKIQLAVQLPPGLTPEETDPCKDFLVDFLPVLQPYLVAP